MDAILEYTSYIMTELDKIDRGRAKEFNGKRVLELAKDVASLARRGKGRYKESDIDMLIKGANGIKNVTEDFIKEAKTKKIAPIFEDPNYRRIANGSLGLMLKAIKNMYGVEPKYNPLFKIFGFG